jgi:predicted transcriptional regulator of viral defense system
MISINELKIEFQRHGGIMKTSELTHIGLNSRQLLKLTRENVISKIKTGVYEVSDSPAPEEVIIARLFPTAVIYLESALLYYGYTDRIPGAWQIAVDKNISKPQFQITYPLILPYFIDKKYMYIGVDYFEICGVKIRVFDRDRTICDVLRYINKLDKEVVNNAIQRYIKDNKRNITKLMEYAEKLRVTTKVKTYIRVWL